jgi:hypothetical protein
MSGSLLFLLLVVILVLAGLVSYALSRNRNVKASCKLRFAVISFEAKQPATKRPKANNSRLS